jgi:hypothetical protein
MDSIKEKGHRLRNDDLFCFCRSPISKGGFQIAESLRINPLSFRNPQSRNPKSLCRSPP